MSKRELRILMVELLVTRVSGAGSVGEDVLPVGTCVEPTGPGNLDGPAGVSYLYGLTMDGKGTRRVLYYADSADWKRAWSTARRVP